MALVNAVLGKVQMVAVHRTLGVSRRDQDLLQRATGRRGLVDMPEQTGQETKQADDYPHSTAPCRRFSVGITGTFRGHLPTNVPQRVSIHLPACWVIDFDLHQSTPNTGAKIVGRFLTRLLVRFMVPNTDRDSRCLSGSGTASTYIEVPSRRMGSWHAQSKDPCSGQLLQDASKARFRACRAL